MAEPGKGKKKTAGKGSPKRKPKVKKSREDELAQLQVKVTELAETNRQLRRRIFDLYTIFEISRNFSAVLDYKTLLDSFIFTCLGQVGVQRGAIFLKPTLEATEFELAECKGSGSMPEADASFSDKTRLVSHLTRLNRPVLIDELSPEITNRDERDILNQFAGGLAVPLIYQTRLAGIFLLADKISTGDFGSEETEFISALGNQIAVAIENARLYEGERSANEQLWNAQRQLVQAERLAALGEVSAMVAHEVNNPLGIIKNYLLLMKRCAGDRVQVGEYVGIVSQEIDRIALIVEELRRFQRPTGIALGPVDVRHILETTLALVERQMVSSGVDMVREWTNDDTFVNGNADHLRQVFLNLALNARAAMSGGGRLTIGLKAEADKVIVRFRDTGPGIPEEIQAQIFEPFFTTKGDDGSGLGLSISYGIIKSHEGSITYKNTDTGGCFEISLPLIVE